MKGITLTEFRNNLGEYLEMMAKGERILIGSKCLVLEAARVEDMVSLRGSLEKNIAEEDSVSYTKELCDQCGKRKEEVNNLVEDGIEYNICVDCQYRAGKVI